MYINKSIGNHHTYTSPPTENKITNSEALKNTL